MLHRHVTGDTNFREEVCREVAHVRGDFLKLNDAHSALREVVGTARSERVLVETTGVPRSSRGLSQASIPQLVGEWTFAIYFLNL